MKASETFGLRMADCPCPGNRPSEDHGRYRPTQSDYAGDRTGTVRMLMGVHIGATWQMRLNHPYAARCGLMSNYFDHLFLLFADMVLM